MWEARRPNPNPHMERAVPVTVICELNASGSMNLVCW